MRLSDFKQEYYEHTAKASDICRQLAFAGIAIIWVYRITDSAKQDTIREELVLPLMLIVISLAADFMQYVWQSFIWRYFYEKEEKKASINEDPELDAPRWYNYPTNFFFYSKILMLIGAYWFLAKFLIDTVVSQSSSV
jgi:hypothetical protein